ncbi:MAG TPA: FtsQ-type POTRA domain-containing protein [Vulgatibacter sp.]
MGTAAYAAMGTYRFATTSPKLAISQIVISGNERATDLEIRAWLGIAEGDNILRADTQAAELRLAEHPWVEKAIVSRSFPQGLAIEVLEREAIALVELGHLYLVDRGGEVFKRAVNGDPMDLPVITGLSRDEWTERPDEAQTKLGEVLGALGIYGESEIAKSHPVSELHFDQTEGLTLYLGDRGLAAKLGSGDLERKLDRLAQVVGFAERRGESLELVRLDNRTRPGWIAARLRSEGGPTRLSLRASEKGRSKGG